MYIYFHSDIEADGGGSDDGAKLARVLRDGLESIVRRIAPSLVGDAVTALEGRMAATVQDVAAKAAAEIGGKTGGKSSVDLAAVRALADDACDRAVEISRAIVDVAATEAARARRDAGNLRSETVPRIAELAAESAEIRKIAERAARSDPAPRIAGIEERLVGIEAREGDAVRVGAGAFFFFFFFFFFFLKF
jgi:hypothetical protein